MFVLTPPETCCSCFGAVVWSTRCSCRTMRCVCSGGVAGAHTSILLLLLLLLATSPRGACVGWRRGRGRWAKCSQHATAGALSGGNGSHAPHRPPFTRGFPSPLLGSWRTLHLRPPSRIWPERCNAPYRTAAVRSRPCSPTVPMRAMLPLPLLVRQVYENRVYDLLQSARAGRRQAQALPIQVVGATCCIPGLLRVRDTGHLGDGGWEGLGHGASNAVCAALPVCRVPAAGCVTGQLRVRHQGAGLWRLTDPPGLGLGYGVAASRGSAMRQCPTRQLRMSTPCLSLARPGSPNST